MSDFGFCVWLNRPTFFSSFHVFGLDTIWGFLDRRAPLRILVWWCLAIFTCGGFLLWNFHFFVCGSEDSFLVFWFLEKVEVEKIDFDWRVFILRLLWCKVFELWKYLCFHCWPTFKDWLWKLVFKKCLFCFTISGPGSPSAMSILHLEV